LLVTLPTGARLLVDAGAVEQVLRSRAPSELLASNAASPVATVPVLKALAQAKMTVQVRLQGCELDAGSLQALQLGDVIRLRHGLQTPAVITNGSGRELFSGWLARSRGRKAVQLAPLGAP
jgi:flagellar motor switch protein FliM